MNKAQAWKALDAQMQFTINGSTEAQATSDAGEDDPDQPSPEDDADGNEEGEAEAEGVHQAAISSASAFTAST